MKIANALPKDSATEYEVESGIRGEVAHDAPYECVVVIIKWSNVPKRVPRTM